MKDKIHPYPQDQPAVYEIQIEGQLDDHMRAWFENMVITEQVEGGKWVTRLTGLVTDQAALHGLLSGIYNLGFVVVFVSKVESPLE